MTTAALWFLMNASILADWGQTRNIAAQRMAPYTETYVYDGVKYYQAKPGGGRKFDETGPASIVIGEHPSRGKVDAFFIGSLALHNGIMIALPKKYRPYYAGAVTATEVYFVVKNNSIGIKIDF